MASFHVPRLTNWLSFSNPQDTHTDYCLFLCHLFLSETMTDAFVKHILVLGTFLWLVSQPGYLQYLFP